MRTSCDTFRKLLVTSAGLSTETSLTNSWPRRRDPLQVLMGFRTALTDVRRVGFAGSFCAHMCWRVVLILRILPKVELSLFPSPPISTTMDGLLDQRKTYAR